MLTETWEDQYRRLHRSYALLKRAVDEYIDREAIHEEANSRDILYHFCADAYHLRDYIWNSTNLSQAIRDGAMALFDVRKNPSASKALRACADIANGFKHLKLTTSKFPGGRPAEVVRQEAGIALPFRLGDAHFTYHFTIEADGVTYREVDIANQAIADWDAWLTSHGLPLPT